jgi:FMN reductase [NAD(P)H]
MDLPVLYDSCRTYRRFLQKPLEPGLLRTLVDVARKRSCGRNSQWLRFVAVEQPENVKAMQPLLHWAAALPKEIGTPKEGGTASGFCGGGQTPECLAHDQRHRSGDRPGCHVAITAWQKEVGSAILAAVDRKKIAALLEIPEELEVNIVLALGYPAHKSNLVSGEKGKSLDYYVDENRDYYVPKLPLEKVAEFK